MFLGDQIQNRMIIVYESTRSQSVSGVAATRSWTTTENEKTLTVAAKDRGMYVAVRVRAELTQDDQYHQELVMFRSASNISDLYQLNDSTYQRTNIRS